MMEREWIFTSKLESWNESSSLGKLTLKSSSRIAIGQPQREESVYSSKSLYA